MQRMLNRGLSVQKTIMTVSTCVYTHTLHVYACSTTHSTYIQLYNMHSMTELPLMARRGHDLHQEANLLIPFHQRRPRLLYKPRASHCRHQCTNQAAPCRSPKRNSIYVYMVFRAFIAGLHIFSYMLYICLPAHIFLFFQGLRSCNAYIYIHVYTYILYFLPI